MKQKVIIVRPGEKAVVEEIDSGYDSLEQIVGGELEFFTPVMDDVVMVCDRWGKKKGKMPNQYIFGSLSIPFIEDGKEVDIFAGTVVIIGYRKGKKPLLDSLTDSEIDLFMDIYGEPQFVMNWQSKNTKEK